MVELGKINRPNGAAVDDAASVPVLPSQNPTSPEMTASPVGDAVISLRNVSKRFASFVALETTSFDIGRGEFFSMLGPSGCGKTTTLRMIAGFERPTDGQIFLSGTDVVSTPPHKRNVNTVFQQYALFPHMTVWDNVAYGLRARKVPKATIPTRVHEMIDVVRMGEFAQRKPTQLSGGQQQRVALARALVNLPEALLLDEPLGALDLKLRQTMQIELKRIQREVGIAFVFVTHDQEEALTMSDRIAVMNRGRVEQIGSPVEIYNQPASIFVAGFIGSANLLPVSVDSVDGRTAAVALSGVRLAANLGAGDQPIVGGDGTLMVRPESIVVGAPGTAPTGLGLAATVADLVFQGPIVRLSARLADGAEVVAHVPSSAAAGVLPGTAIDLSWPAHAPVVLAGLGVPSSASPAAA